RWRYPHRRRDGRPPRRAARRAPSLFHKYSRRQAMKWIAMLALALATPWAAAQAPIVIKFSQVVATDTPKGKGAQRFKELAEARTNGRVKIEVYPNSQLYKDKEELEALQLGSVQMLAPSVSKFGPMGVKAFEAFDLPYLFDSYDAAHKITHGPIGEAVLRQSQQQEITGL